jgi:hypothetical protein
LIRKFAGHDTEHPPGTVTLKDYIVQAQKEECQIHGNCTQADNYGTCKAPCPEGLTKTDNLCYTITTDPIYRITTGMSLRDFKDGIGQAYWNRDRETLDRLLESLIEAK